ncbi:MAG: glucose-6-phosphate isomerase [Planctomycetota bacterium]
MPEQDTLLELDDENMYQSAVGREHGLTVETVDAYADDISEYTDRIQERRGGDLGFMDLPYDSRLVDTIEEKASSLGDWCENFVVLGIGGSALGNITLNRALLHPQHNLLPADHPARDGNPRVFVLDNVDPHRIKGLLKLLRGQMSKTAFNVITKSGSTAETMSLFLHVRELLSRIDGCDPARQMILTTDEDPVNSVLRRIGEDGDYFMLPLPRNVGGRFSVLSAVGLMQAAACGINVAELLEGAAAMDEQCRENILQANPAALYACLLYEHYRNGKHIDVLMPYTDSLSAFSDWFCQLWAESLGKRHGIGEKNVFRGPTPVGAVGVTDQHSVMQLFQDGPFDKVLTLLEVTDEDGVELPICPGEAEEELEYLAEHSFDELFHAELQATRCALRDKNRPNCTLRIPEVSERTLGELFMFFEYAVTYSGYLYQVNAFNQPGVELGKQYTYGLMGRDGYESPQL